LIEVTDFQEQVLERSYETPVLVDVWATWCHPCKAQAPILDAINEEYDIDVVKLDADENMEQITAMGVRSVPTLLWYVNGTEVRRETGLKSKKDLLAISADVV